MGTLPPTSSEDKMRSCVTSTQFRAWHTAALGKWQLFCSKGGNHAARTGRPWHSVQHFTGGPGTIGWLSACSLSLAESSAGVCFAEDKSCRNHGQSPRTLERLKTSAYILTLRRNKEGSLFRFFSFGKCKTIQK